MISHRDQPPENDQHILCHDSKVSTSYHNAQKQGKLKDLTPIFILNITKFISA